VLELLSRFLGSHPEAQLLYARTLYLNGSMEAAARKAASILGSNANSTQAALLVVSIHLRQGRAAAAMSALEAAVSANFGIRDTPLYHVVHAQVLMANGQLEEARKVGTRSLSLQCCAGMAAFCRDVVMTCGRCTKWLSTIIPYGPTNQHQCVVLQVLETAMSLPGVRSPASAEQAARLAKRGCLPSVHERARIFLLLAEVITSIGKPQAAAEVRKVRAGLHCRTRQDPAGPGRTTHATT
jgi:tetratricopeptide repeat protein 21B